MNVVKIAVLTVTAVGTGYAAWYYKKRSDRKENEQFLAREKHVLTTLDYYLQDKDEDRKTQFLQHPNVINAIDDYMQGNRSIAELERALKFVNDHLV